MTPLGGGPGAPGTLGWLPARLPSLPSAPLTWEDRAGVVVVGAGAAGASVALEAAANGADVLVLAKAPLGMGASTPWAQGGLAAVLDPADSPEAHLTDTLEAGAGLCDPAVVAALVASAPGEVVRLTTLGAAFDLGHLGLEGGHSARRIVHAGGDASGAEVHRVLAGELQSAAGSGRLRLAAPTAIVDLIVDDDGTCVGVLAGRVGEGGRLDLGVVHAAAVVLATGGYGQVYSSTTNPDGVTGDGLAAAARAGAELADVEMVQFHPTLLWQPGGRGRRPLVTEALRGAGAVLVDDTGRRVMAGVHPLGDLAPRDVVASTMHQRMAATGAAHLWLDATGLGRERIESEFPTVTASCRKAGIDPAVGPIPVVPGAHYCCGGVRADLEGATSLPGLWAIGEAASTGLHGANRLASNSLTEALTAGRRLGRHLAGRAPAPPRGTESRPLGADPRSADPRSAIAPSTAAPGSAAPGSPGGAPSRGTAGAWGVDPAGRDGRADAVSRHAGVLRNGEGLEHLVELLAHPEPARGRLDLAGLEATNLHAVATLLAASALTRTESRGCHRRSDHPEPRPEWQRRLSVRVEGGKAIFSLLPAPAPTGSRR